VYVLKPLKAYPKPCVPMLHFSVRLLNANSIVVFLIISLLNQINHYFQYYII